MKDYIEQAHGLSTHPDDAHLSYIDQQTLDRVYHGFAACSADAERLKKQLFKGRDLPKFPSIDPIRSDDIESLHADLGIMGESGELVEADNRTDVLLEGGDLLWYIAKKFKRFGITFNEAMEANIEKLQKRRAAQGQP